MTQLHETAYPRLKADPSAQDLDEIYTLTPEEIAFIDKTVKRPIARSAAFIYLKLFQRLGYFVHIRDVPSVIRQHIVAQTGYRPPMRSVVNNGVESFKRLAVEHSSAG